jgi:hypothetical protein
MFRDKKKREVCLDLSTQYGNPLSPLTYIGK